MSEERDVSAEVKYNRDAVNAGFPESATEEPPIPERYRKDYDHLWPKGTYAKKLIEELGTAEAQLEKIRELCAQSGKRILVEEVEGIIGAPEDEEEI